MQEQQKPQSVRLLLLSAAYGAGHVRAAEACMAHAKQSGIHTEHIEILSLLPTPLAFFLRNAYTSLVRTLPHTYGWLYRTSLNQTTCRVYQSLSYPIIRWCTVRQIARHIHNQRPSHIICTHFWGSEILDVLIKKGIDVPPYYVCITDYGYHPMWYAPHAAGYLVAADQVRQEMITKGIPPEIIHVTGIPVDPIFSQPHDEPRDRITILLGGYGLVAPVTDIAQVVQSTQMPIHIICGKNTRLHARLTTRFKHESHVTVHGWVDITDHILRSTRVITKPGGLTITECLVARTPIEIISPIPGQETVNYEFLRAANLLSPHTKTNTDNVPVFAMPRILTVLSP